METLTKLEKQSWKLSFYCLCSNLKTFLILALSFEQINLRIIAIIIEISNVFLGFQTRDVRCAVGHNTTVEEKYCEAVLKPTSSRTCNNEQCKAIWQPQQWSEVMTFSNHFRNSLIASHVSKVKRLFSPLQNSFHLLNSLKTRVI